MCAHCFEVHSARESELLAPREEGSLDSAPPVPLLPAAGAGDDMPADKTEALMRAVVGYNTYHSRRVIQEGMTCCKGFPDVPVHQLAPLEIRRPDSVQELPVSYTQLTLPTSDLV